MGIPDSTEVINVPLHLGLPLRGSLRGGTFLASSMRNIVETLKISLRLLTIDERHMFVTPELFLRLPNFLRLPEICLRVPNERSGSNDLAGKTRAGYNFSANGSDHSQ